MQTQSPSDAPEPPPPEKAPRSPRHWWWIYVVVLILIFVVIGLLTAPMVIRCPRKSDQTEAVNNARQIGMALFEFETEYGKFPDATTIAAVGDATGTTIPQGTRFSNDYFRQLIASGISLGEGAFHAKTKDTPRRITDNAHVLGKGEVGFSYLAGLHAKGNPSRPLIVTPLIPGTDRFDPKPFDGKAIIIKMDCSVTSMAIDKDGHVMVLGKNLLDPTNPVWGPDDKFVITYPDL